MGNKNADNVTACFFGDGTSNNGQFFETLNMAALWKLPILFVVENNKWAIGMAHERATSQPEIYKKASVFGMPGYEVDGMDVLAMRDVAQKAVARARAGEGPTLIEALTYRFRVTPSPIPTNCGLLKKKNSGPSGIQLNALKNLSPIGAWLPPRN